MSSRGVSLPLARSRVARKVGLGDHDSPEAIPFTPRSKRIIALAVEEALEQGDEHIGTEHLLLAILREHQAVSAGILQDLGVDPDRLRQMIRTTPPETESRDSISSPAVAEDAGCVSGPQVTTQMIEPEVFSDARRLAQAFASAVCEPAWWPPDTEPVSYRLLRSSGRREHYEIGSVRRDGIPICVVGHREAAMGGRSPRDWLTGEWSEPPELSHLSGLIGAVGIPRRLQAVAYDSGLQLQFIGYDTEQEIIRAATSLHRTPSSN